MQQKQLERTRRGTHTLYHHSLKCEQSFWCESGLEADYLLTLEFDDDVDAFVTQPLSIQWHDGDRIRRYTPDVLVWRKDRREFIEVKPLEDVTPALRWKITRLDARCLERFGTRLRLVTEQDFLTGAKLANLKLLYGYKRIDLRSSCTDALAGLPSETTFAKLRAYARRSGLPEALPFALLAQGRYRFDPTQDLGDNTVVEAA